MRSASALFVLFCSGLYAGSLDPCTVDSVANYIHSGGCSIDGLFELRNFRFASSTSGGAVFPDFSDVLVQPGLPLINQSTQAHPATHAGGLHMLFPNGGIEVTSSQSITLHWSFALMSKPVPYRFAGMFGWDPSSQWIGANHGLVKLCFDGSYNDMGMCDGSTELSAQLDFASNLYWEFQPLRTASELGLTTVFVVQGSTQQPPFRLDTLEMGAIATPEPHSVAITAMGLAFVLAARILAKSVF